ncbi:MAG: carbon-nitrogen hydrolase [Calditrichaeota bacterium]|nr:carbon-nitrogen hydrolase [Calditrichota bacterium]
MSHKLNISVAQIDCVLGEIEPNLEKHYKSIEQAIDQKSDLIVFPELSLTGYFLKDAVSQVAMSDHDSKLDRLKELSKHIGIAVGMAELSEKFEFFNTQLFFHDGELIAKHRKVYLPTYSLFEEKRYFSEGTRIRAFDTPFGRLGMLICEDMWHPTSGLIQAHDGASIIIVSAAGVARGATQAEKPQNVIVWETLNRSMAVFTTSYIVFVNRVGVEDGVIFWGGSEIIHPGGSGIQQAPYYSEALMQAEIDLLELKHARVNTQLLREEKFDLLLHEFSRLSDQKREYK